MQGPLHSPLHINGDCIKPFRVLGTNRSSLLTNKPTAVVKKAHQRRHVLRKNNLHKQLLVSCYRCFIRSMLYRCFILLPGTRTAANRQQTGDPWKGSSVPLWKTLATHYSPWKTSSALNQNAKKIHGTLDIICLSYCALADTSSLSRQRLDDSFYPRAIHNLNTT